MGWYHNEDLSYWGCYKGYKVKDTKLAEHYRVNSNYNNDISNNKINKDKLFDLKYNENKKSDDKDEIDKLFDDIDKKLDNQDNNTNEVNQNILDSNFRKHDIVVESINNSNLSWKAKNYNFIKDKSINELSLLTSGKYIDRSNLKPLKLDISDLPKHFNKWVDEGYVPEPKQQGNCGACYAISTVHMIESRLRIKYKQFKENEIKLSVQHVLDCS